MNINHSAHKSLLVDFIFIHCTLLIVINWAMQYNKFVCEWSSLWVINQNLNLPLIPIEYNYIQ